MNAKTPLYLRFDEVAALYDRARPQCPDDALDCAVDRLDLPTQSHVLEVGCATGQATRGLLKRVARITAVDAGANLIAYAENTFRGEERVAWVCAHFDAFAQSYTGPRFDAMFGVQCMHWMDPQDSLKDLTRVLKPQKGLALIWHRDRSQETPFWKATSPLYNRWMPPRAAHKTVTFGAVAYRRALESDPQFRAVHVDRFAWSHVYKKSAYMDLINTFSDHRALAPQPKEALFRGIADVVEAQGGRVERLYETVVLTARRV